MRPGKRVRQAWLGLAFALLAGSAAAQPQAGREFNRIAPAPPPSTGGRIEVTEFFYYGCPVCYETEPLLSRWLASAPDYVSVRRVPALVTEAGEPFAKLYYALESLGEIERLHWPVYDNFHFDGIALNDEKIMADWVARNGIDRQKFLETYASAEVAGRVAQARELLKARDIRGVPTFVVDGKFVTSARLAGGTKQVVEVLDHLVRRAREERPR